MHTHLYRSDETQRELFEAIERAQRVIPDPVDRLVDAIVFAETGKKYRAANANFLKVFWKRLAVARAVGAGCKSLAEIETYCIENRLPCPGRRHLYRYRRWLLAFDALVSSEMQDNQRGECK